MWHGLPQPHFILGERSVTATETWAFQIPFHRRLTSGQPIHSRSSVPDAQYGIRADENISKSMLRRIDLSHGYWQLPLHPDSQQCQSFVASDVIYTPRRFLQGTPNAETYLQSKLETIIPKQLQQNILF